MQSIQNTLILNQNLCINNNLVKKLRHNKYNLLKNRFPHEIENTATSVNNYFRVLKVTVHSVRRTTPCLNS